MTRSRFPRIKGENGRLNATVSAFAFDPRGVLFGAGAYFQIDGPADEADAFCAQRPGLGQFLHRGLLSDAQTMAHGRGRVTAHSNRNITGTGVSS